MTTPRFPRGLRPSPLLCLKLCFSDLTSRGLVEMQGWIAGSRFRISNAPRGTLHPQRLGCHPGVELRVHKHWEEHTCERSQ